MDNRNIILSDLGFYLQISKDAHQNYKLMCSKRDSLLLSDQKDLDYFALKCVYIQDIIKYAYTAIVFEALAIEAFANEYLHCSSGNSFAKDLDKLSAIEKIMIAYRFNTDKNFDRSRESYFLLKELFKIRNELVHSKPVIINLMDNDVLKKVDGYSEKRRIYTDNNDKILLEKLMHTYEYVIKDIFCNNSEDYKRYYDLLKLAKCPE